MKREITYLELQGYSPIKLTNGKVTRWFDAKIVICKLLKDSFVATRHSTDPSDGRRYWYTIAQYVTDGSYVFPREVFPATKQDSMPGLIMNTDSAGVIAFANRLIEHHAFL